MMNGLTKQELQKYWIDRSTQQGKRTVGYAGHDSNQQDIEYNEKISFVLPYTFLYQLILSNIFV